jgi:sulfate adenylyltransferase subunit 2
MTPALASESYQSDSDRTDKLVLDTELGCEHSAAKIAENPPIRSHLDWLESQSIEILREVASEFANPVLLYSIGKDSAVLLHLLIKAFYPAKPPMPLLHVDTGWKFQAMYQLRDQVTRRLGLDLRVHKNLEGIARGLKPYGANAGQFTDVMKTQGLLQALKSGNFDAAIGGARRDEEASRAKERVFSFRSDANAWDPKNQRPELWNLYNTRIFPGESVRVFPLSNWTELDVWLYIQRESIEVVPLYFAAPRKVIERAGQLIMLDDDRLPLLDGEAEQTQTVRFRTLGCYPLTAAVRSSADTVPRIIAEMLQSRSSERQGRLIDHDQSASMEKKKREGYF